MIIKKKNPSIHLNNIFSDKKGNISLISITAVLIISFLFLLLFDLSSIFIARAKSKKAADAAALAIAQDILFIDTENIKNTTNIIELDNKCRIKEVYINYDKVTVTAEKSVNFFLLGIFGIKDLSISSVSSSKILYPWDEIFGLVERYRFNYSN